MPQTIHSKSFRKMSVAPPRSCSRRICTIGSLADHLAHFSLDGTKLAANASKHAAVSYERAGRILPISEGLPQTHGQDARATAGVQMLAVSRNAKLQGAPIRQTSSRFHDERTYWVA
jgi:hypothetical protein